MHDWDNFYVIVGSAAAALTGLQFIVLTLVAQLHRQGARSDIDAFGTPSIAHYAHVLLVSAVISAPWPNGPGVGIALAVCGTWGVVYVLLVARRTAHARYQPVAEDWIWHVVLPFVAYAMLLGGAVALLTAATSQIVAFFLVAAAALLLLFIGIHNAWDTVTYIVTGAAEGADRSEP